MSLDVLKERIKSNNISGVYLFCGPEEYTKDHYASRIRKKVDSSPLPEFNHVYFNAASQRVADLEDAVFALPYMCESKLIEITDLEFARFSADEIEEYERVFSDIPDYLTILMVLRYNENVVIAKNEKTKEEENENTKEKNYGGLPRFIDVVKKFGLMVEFQNEKGDKLTTWITRHFSSRGVTFEANVPREIVSVCGSDMYILQSEITKLSEAFDGKPLTAADVRRYCCVNSSYKYFDLATVLMRRDISGAKRIWESLDLKRDEIPMALGFLAKKYAEMLIVKTGIDSGKSQDQMAKDLGIKPSMKWLVGKIASSIGSVDSKMISYAISQLSDADIKLKNYRGNPERILELAFYRITTYGRKA